MIHRTAVLSGLILLIFTSYGNAQRPLTFVFGSIEEKRGFTRVQASDTYRRDRGFGFEPGATVQCENRKAGNCVSDKPFYFSVAVPEGNYRVTVTLGGGQPTDETVKAELR